MSRPDRGWVQKSESRMMGNCHVRFGGEGQSLPYCAAVLCSWAVEQFNRKRKQLCKKASGRWSQTPL